MWYNVILFMQNNLFCGMMIRAWLPYVVHNCHKYKLTQNKGNF